MGNYFIIWVLINYILSITILFISILKHWSLLFFLKNMAYLVIGTNLIFIIISMIKKTISKENEPEHVIDMVIPIESEDEGKQILKEASQLDSERQSGSEFEDWTPEK